MTIYTKADRYNHIKKIPRKNEACFVGQRSLLRFWDKFCVNVDTHTDCTESTDEEPNSAQLLED